MVSIITDSSCDLPKEVLKAYNIQVVPLKIIIDGVEYVELQDITAKEFGEKMTASGTLPKTSQPSPERFRDAFESALEKKSEKDAPEILCLTISSQLSGTYQSACLGKDLVKDNGNITVFDTLGGSIGHGLQVVKAAEMAATGVSLEEIIDALERHREEMNIFILLDTLENIVKGGRLGRVQGAVAGMLNIKILLEGVEGRVELLEKRRGRKKITERLFEIVDDRRGDFSQKVFGITHVNNEKDALVLKEEIIRRFEPQDVIIYEMGGTMGTYAGEGGMIISF
ncbi:DegV family protein [Isachenkonia alkalipeptolytica]|uniref:DegV family protein n=1 Tax=Isachenkonia alkalipeptolytica TaxID=2565777 RepID=A0AA43XIX1_9CLOT|nr:DegV family protein [Isachenkonia alkalipeptolytica]NBG87655.1 DegV family protein [Isachenkonia alkalipeptolytica]